jgi:ABC-type phosphate/phosphonate transport system ATPase subunit
LSGSVQLGTHSTSLSRLVLTSAPRVMLIDDPIAHVDDLNSLSFLDYLREIAIRGHRQSCHR